MQFNTMKRAILNYVPALLAITFAFTSCKKDDSGNTAETTKDKYAIISATTKWDAGFLTSFDGMPSGTVSNKSSQSLQVASTFGFRSYGKWIFNRANAAGTVGLQKYTISDDGSIQDGGFIVGSTQFVIQNETSGFYLDENRGLLKIQKFNPTTMQRTGEIDLSSLQKNGVEYQVIGKHTLAIKEGKLYAGISYGTNVGQGFSDNIYNYIEFAVVDIATGKLDKTIKYDGFKGIGWGSSGNKMWTIGDDGALYLYETGLDNGFTKSAIIRIKKGETDFDRNWILDAADFQISSSLATALVKGGKIYIELPSEPLTGDFSNLQNTIYDYYAIDLTTKQKTKIGGMPQHHYAYANDQAITEIDGKVYFWVRNPEQKIDGYYVLDGNNATQVFNVNHDGFMWGFVRLK
jgi:hypothetical protein